MQDEFVKRCYKSDLRYQVHYVFGKYANRAYSAQLHYDTDLTIAYFKNATGNIKIEGNNYPLKSGDIIILNYNEVHCVELQCDFCERITIYLDELLYRNYSEQVNSLLHIFHKRKKGEENLIPAEIVSAHGMDTLIEEIKECAEWQDSVADLVAFGKITELLKKINQVAVGQSQSEDNSCSNNPIVNQVIQYIGLHFAEDISCDSIADKMYISKYYLGKLFKETVGITLWNYIINRRLLNFNDLVRKNESVEQACSKSGFHNYSNFYKLYKKRMGISPQEFKRSITKNNRS